MSSQSQVNQSHLNEIANEIELICQRLQLKFEQNLSIKDLQTDNFYFRILQQLLQDNLFQNEEEARLYSKADKGSRIQYLIDYLSNVVLKVELEHINGIKIAQGSLIDIRNFLQLINEMLSIQEQDDDGQASKSYEPKPSESKQKAKSSSNSDNYQIDERVSSGTRKSLKGKEPVSTSKREVQRETVEPNNRLSGSNRKRHNGDQSSPKQAQSSTDKKRPTSKQLTRSSVAERKTSTRKANFSKKSRPEVIQSVEATKRRPANSAQQSARSSARHVIMEALNSIGSDPGVHRIMQNQNLDPQKLQETLTRTSSKYEQIVKDYLRFREDKGSFEASQTKFVAPTHIIRSIQAFEQQMYAKLLREKASHDIRMESLLQKFQKLKLAH